MARTSTLLAAMGALCMWLAYPPVGIVVLAIGSPWALAMIARCIAKAEKSRGAWRAYAAVLGVGCAKWIALNFWLYQVTLPGMLALSLYCACFDVAAVWLLVRGRAAIGATLPWAILLPVMLGAVESARALVLFDGYPWFRAGHPLGEWPVLVQQCDLGGEVMATLLVGSVAGACVDALARGRERRWGVGLALAALLFAFAYGAFRLGQAPVGDGPGILAIQTNVATSNKVAWEPQQQVADLGVSRELTISGALAATRDGRAIALAVWPETMLPGYGLEPDVLAMMEHEGYFPGARYQRVVANLSTQLGAPLLVGSPVYIRLRKEQEHWTWERQFNSAYLVGSEPPPYPRYDKLFLAPFGETMPYIRAWPALQEALLSLGAQGMKFDLSPGDHPVHFTIPWRRPDGRDQAVRIAAPICFEDAMSWVCRDLVYTPGADGRQRRADLLVNLSNDGWFGWFDGGRAQHVQLARFRCIETRTPMVRVANTGLCAGIDSSGRISQEPIPPQTPGWLYCNPPLDDRTPLFAAVGDALSWLLMCASALLAALSYARPRAPARPSVRMAALVVGIGTGALVLIGGCADTPSVPQHQPWSSREQSMSPSGQARLSDRGDGSTGLPVASSGSARETAVTLLQQATRSPIPVFRANAVEGLIYSPQDLQPVLRATLADTNRGVRFVAAMAVGRAGVVECVDAVQPLLKDESASVRAAAIYAMTKCGHPVDQTPLAAMTRSDDPEIRSNAYMVLGELGNPSALPVIRDSLGKGLRKVNPARVRIIELQAAEAMVRLGDPDQVEPVRAALLAPSGGPADQSEIVIFAAQTAGRLHDEGSRPMLVRLIEAKENPRPAEIRLMAALALAELGEQDHRGVARLARDYLRDKDPVVRSQAALALGRSEGSQCLPDLEKLLFDPEPGVQLAAAKAALVATKRR